MFKHRLTFGALMIVFLAAILIFDGWLDGSLTAAAPDKPVQGTLLCILIAGLVIPAQLELSRLAAARNLRIFTAAAVVASALLATSRYWPQLIDVPFAICLPVLLALTLMLLFLCQYVCCGTSAVMANCGASCLCVFYLGILSSFVLAVRIDFGLWRILMFICVVKSADIGAYAIGSLFGKHKFSPRISPGKTWEGMAGATAAAVAVALLFATCCDIMDWLPAMVFGLLFAVVGQMGDLVESMIKRDAGQKDSASKVPGFGGILDIIDSPLVAAPFAYLFFLCCT